MKFVEKRSFADPEAAARKLLELADAFEPIQAGRIYIEKINGPFLFALKGSRRSTRPALIMRSPRAGWSCTRAGHFSASPRRAPRCLPTESPCRGCRKSERTTPLSLAATLCAIPTRIKTTRTSYRSKGLTSSTSL